MALRRGGGRLIAPACCFRNRCCCIRVNVLSENRRFLRHGYSAVQVYKIAAAVLAAAFGIAVFNPRQLRGFERGLLLGSQLFTQIAKRLVERLVGLREQVARTVNLVEGITRFGAASGLGARSQREGSDGQRQQSFF